MVPSGAQAGGSLEQALLRAGTEVMREMCSLLEAGVCCRSSGDLATGVMLTCVIKDDKPHVDALIQR